MRFVSCVKWVRKGVAQKIPDDIHLNEEELKNIIDDAGPDDNEENDEGKVSNSNPDSGDEYDMKNYDAEDDNLRVTLKGIIDFDNTGTQKSKKRLKKSKRKLMDDDMSDDEKHDEEIKDDDNLILLGQVDEDLNTIEVHVYNECDGDMYIHHDMILKSPPLCIDWLNIETESGPMNMCAVGTMDPVIELWDLDLVNCVQPITKLGRSKKKNEHKNFGHTDAVLTVAWNAELPHILCSGSVDKSVLLWDLESGKVATEIKVFTDKVQNALWNPRSEYHLLTGCADGKIRNFDCRLYDDYLSFDLNDSIESILWNPDNEHICYAGTETGDIYALDFRSTAPLFKFSGHSKEVTGLGIYKSDVTTLYSVSTDKRFKLWNLNDDGVELSHSVDYELGGIHCIDANPDYPHVVCVGGSTEKRSKSILKVTNLQSFGQTKSETPSTDLSSIVETSGVSLLESEPRKRDGKFENKKKGKKRKVKGSVTV